MNIADESPLYTLTIEQNIEAVKQRIARAVERAVRSPADVTLVAVTKTASTQDVRRAFHAGLRHFGENRVQEAQRKIDDLAEIRSETTWHMVGTLQTNKAQAAVRLFDIIESVASLHLAERLDQLVLQKKPVYLEVNVAGEAAKQTQQRIELLKKALDDTPKADATLADDLRALDGRLKDVLVVLDGDAVRARRNEPTAPGVASRVQQVVGGSWVATAAPTGTQQEDYEIAAKQFSTVLHDLRTLIETDLRSIEERAEAAGAPWTPGRLPRWEP